MQVSYNNADWVEESDKTVNLTRSDIDFNVNNLRSIIHLAELDEEVRGAAIALMGELLRLQERQFYN